MYNDPLQRLDPAVALACSPKQMIFLKKHRQLKSISNRNDLRILRMTQNSNGANSSNLNNHTLVMVKQMGLGYTWLYKYSKTRQHRRRISCCHKPTSAARRGGCHFFSATPL